MSDFIEKARKEFREKFVITSIFGSIIGKPEYMGNETKETEDIENFLESKLRELEKAYGNCQKCYGKGYSTVRYGLKTSADFEGEKDYIDPIKTNIHFCTCDRGKQLEEQFKTLSEQKDKEWREKIKRQVRDLDNSLVDNEFGAYEWNSALKQVKSKLEALLSEKENK